MTSLQSPAHGRAPFASSLLALLCTLASCKTAARSEEISPGAIQIARQHGSVVEVRTESFRAGFLRGARIPADNLKEAIVAAITESGVFQLPEEDAKAPADYRLSARVEEVQEEDYSLDMTAVVRIEWILTKPRQQEPLWMVSLETNHKATPFDSSDMKARMLLALEGATRKNIKKALQQLAKLELPNDGATTQSEILAR